jgi:hypothetical protein
MCRVARKSTSGSLTVIKPDETALGISLEYSRPPIFKSEFQSIMAEVEIFDQVGLHGSEQITIEIPQNFRSFVDGALVRVRAQYPSLRFVVSAAGVEVACISSDDLDDVRKSVLHAVYREKIYVETLPLRQALIEAVTAK